MRLAKGDHRTAAPPHGLGTDLRGVGGEVIDLGSVASKPRAKALAHQILDIESQCRASPARFVARLQRA